MSLLLSIDFASHHYIFTFEFLTIKFPAVSEKTKM